MKRFLQITLISFIVALILYFVVPNLNDQIENKEWILIDSSLELDLSLSTISLNFDGDVMHGQSGVNLYSASYNLNGQYIHRSSIMVTEMASMDPRINRIEQQYLQLLESAEIVKIDQSELVLLDENEQELLRFIQLISNE